MTVELRAPAGKFRVVAVDTFEGEDWVEDDFPTLIEAISHALETVKGEEMLKVYIYDDQGVHRGDYGDF